jgi:pimeloyl-ACP methyl ester carboxylesterase
MRRVLWIGLFLIFSLSATAFAQDTFFDSAGVQIRYLEKGSGEPVVLIHGYAGNLDRTWVESGVMDDLAKDYRVIALDLRAHGKSGKPRDPAQYGTQVSQDVVRLLHHLGVRAAHIVGYSYGGVTTAKLLATNPECFLTAILVASSGRRSWTEQDARESEAEAEELEHGLPYRSLILRTWPTDQPPPSEEVLREMSRQYAARNDPPAHAALRRGRAGEVVTDDLLASVRVPTLAVVGGADGALAGVKALKAAWPDLDVVVIEGASHTGDRGILRRPEFVQAIRAFLAAHRVSATGSK